MSADRVSRGLALAPVVWLSMAPVGAWAQDDPTGGRVRQAIEDAVHARVGPTATIDITSLDGVTVVDAAGAFVASPDLGARVGQPARFTLFAADTSRHVRVGEATAVVLVTADAVRLRHAVARGDLLRDVDVEVVRRPLDGERLTPWPGSRDAVGARASRDLASGATLTAVDLTVEPAVRSGEHVRVVVRMRSVEVASTAVALQSGAVNDLISLVNPDSRHALRGRVVGHGEVEVIDGQ